MQMNTLGQTDLTVSRVCLGTMTFGNQNTQAEAFEQLDYAWAQGVNFLDAAEMYPIPVKADYQGMTETIIGRWMQARQNRDQVIIATKVAGPGEMVSFLRPDMRLDRRNIRAAIEGSLQRLQTDYIDLYQLHWPDRATNYFGRLGYQHQPQLDGTPILETLQVLQELVQEGLVRYIGLSNETAWGCMTFLKYADQLGLPRVVSVQNPYSLLNRSAEVGLAEVMQRESVDLLAYSPLAFGTLSGKYLQGAKPEGARLTLYPEYTRYQTVQGQQAVEAYVDLAREAGLSPATLALAFVNSRPFLGSNIIGATRMDQLRENIAAEQVSLSADLVAQIEQIHQLYSNPCP
ncbi:NADP(H)-dependent aldo-keto reductase [Neptuniibacter sp. CAU 1671]|uniref:NADP(H)-dependent aldo-keto reductase n=1 Tax=Neptuniibacter sp. CAU 1671 TaxID=3032593 RepID=UPI0023DBC60C|nr:NADP(H)-dependent aldo-keto reductase [Neptuniibacter sp. CAU 1671]MDF2182653.1 NADP(H)-dependent aldo-keto reductase [Neptuniibacter sp. CAU 1671]